MMRRLSDRWSGKRDASAGLSSIASGASRRSLAALLLIGFVAGALATLTFHQGIIWLLSALGAIQANAYSWRPVAPFGVPQVINLAFWGGLWGCVFALIADRFPRSWPLWLAGFLFGAIAPTLVGWFVIAPLRGQPMAQGFVPARMWAGPVINGVYGLGTAVFFAILRRWALARRGWA
jgi:hypothetical protein